MFGIKVYTDLCMLLTWAAGLPSRAKHHSLKVFFFHVKEAYTEDSVLALLKSSFCPMQWLHAGTVDTM